MLKIDVVSSPKGATVALGWVSNSSETKKGAEIECVAGGFEKEVKSLQKRLKDSGHFLASNKEASLLRFVPLAKHENTLLVGLGSREQLNGERMRELGGTLFFVQKQQRLDTVSLDIQKLLKGQEASAQWVQAIAEGYLMAHYDYSLKTSTKSDDSKLPSPKGLEIVASESSLKKAAQKGVTLAEAVNLARSLGDRPGNYLTPTEFSKIIQGVAKKYPKMTVKVHGRKDLDKFGMGLFVGVAKGSEEEPKLIHMTYRGGKQGQKPVALVGKGITFDSGGISLKPSPKMEEMKYDMMGAAAVAGIMQAAVALKLPINLDGYIGAAENMPDGKAQKPGDVATSFSGKTVEIINTDAEGRLVLADVLEYAQSKKPEAIIDFATLTGAVLVALGTCTSGIMGNHPGLIERVKESSERTGERVWQLPLYADYDEDMKSPVADIRNSGNREAGSQKGGCFLKFFVDEKMPWVHCDIAGTAWARRDANYLPSKFGSGVMVRTIADLLENWKPIK